MSPDRVRVIGRGFIATAMIVFGLQHLEARQFVTRIVPEAPAWWPAPTALAPLLGLGLVAGGIALMFDRHWSRKVALALGGALLACFLLAHVPRLMAQPINGRYWTHGLKCLALAGGALAIAAVIPVADDAARRHVDMIRNQWLLRMARTFLGVFMMYCCFLHFIYASAVAALVPAWIPGALPWTYVTGVALFAGGFGLLLPKTRRLAAAASGLMIFSWVLVLHAPHALARPGHGETAAVFEALAFSGLALMIATLPPRSVSVPLSPGAERAFSRRT